MKTKELIEMLKECDPEEEVSFQMKSGCCGDYEYMEVESFYSSDYASHAETQAGIKCVIAQIYFYSLPGYHSCRQVGATFTADKEYWEHFNKPERVHTGPVPVDHEDKKK